MSDKKSKVYDASSISWTKGAEAIRANAALYLGSTNSTGVTHLGLEVVGNCIDEAASGYGKKIFVDFDQKTGVVTVADHGRGIPVGKHPKYPEYDTLTLVATELHTGGKSRTNNEGYSVGTIGCFTGDTKVRVFNGPAIKFKDLYKLYDKDPTIRVHGFSYVGGEICVKPIVAVHKTRKVLTLAEVKFKGIRKPVQCTVDHPFLTINGMVRAEDLIKGSAVLSDKNDVYGAFGVRVVTSVKIRRLKKEVPVYGMTIATEHIYMLDAGVFVGNTHGLGLAVVNALSSKMEIWTFRKKWYYQAFKNGKPIKRKPEVVTDIPTLSKEQVNGSAGGTIIRFKPDLSCFDKDSHFDGEAFKKWMRDLSWFATCNEIKRDKIVNRTPVKFITRIGKPEVITSPGFAAYFETMLKTNKLEPVTDKPFVIQTSTVDVLIGWSSSDDDLVRGYTNGAFNASGGVHVKTLTDIIGKVFSNYAKKKQKYKVQDLLAGAIVLCNIRLKSPRFDSQAKTRLVSEEAKTIVTEAVEQEIIKWAKRNSKTVKELITRACAISAATASMKNDRRLAAALKTRSRGKSIYPDGMLVSTTKNPDERELYLVEGESAAGSAAKGSDRRFQEVLPLRGKIPNVMKGEEKAFASKIILDILRAIGYTPQDGAANLRVGKIVIMTDADDDGAHISSLLMALIQTIAPELYKQGRVFIADTPLFIYNGVNGKKTYAPTLEELTKKVGSKIDNSKVTRAKGLGEVDAGILHEVAFNPATRTFIRLTPEEVSRRMRKVMGDDIQYRKQLIGLYSL